MPPLVLLALTLRLEVEFGGWLDNLLHYQHDTLGSGLREAFKAREGTAYDERICQRCVLRPSDFAVQLFLLLWSVQVPKWRIEALRKEVEKGRDLHHK